MTDPYRTSLEKLINGLIVAIGADIVNKDYIEIMYDDIYTLIDEEKGNYIDVKELDDYDVKGNTFNEMLKNRLIKLGNVTSDYNVDIDNLNNLINRIGLQIDYLLENEERHELDIEVYNEWEKFIIFNFENMIKE